jgi:5-formyltetrahydrofolate cyclo-ligase
MVLRFDQKGDTLSVMDSLDREKRVLRAEIKKELASLRAGEREEKSEKIRTLLVSAEFWPSLSAVAAFFPLPDEPDVISLLRQALREGKTLFLPRIDGGNLVFHSVPGLEENLPLHAYGIPEPSPLSPPADWAAAGARTLFLVPGRAFDRRGGRLGRGKGFYDRFFQSFIGKPSLVLGTAFSRQIVERVPAGGTDFLMQGLVTEEGILYCSAQVREDLNTQGNL